MTNTTIKAPAPAALARTTGRWVRFGVALLIAALVGAGIAAGVSTIANDPQPSVTWQFPTTIEGLIESGLIPVESLGIDITAAVWGYPTTIQGLVQTGLIPTGR